MSGTNTKAAAAAKASVPYVAAPHPDLQDALFCYATGDDGASAVLIRGWSALVAQVESEVARGETPWSELLADLDYWSNDGWDVPHRYSESFEDGYMAIYRISEAAAPAAPDQGLTNAERAELDRLRNLVNTPTLHSFRDGVVLEAVHQRERWGSDHDAGKAPADWFWLVGFLAGKALHAQTSGNTEKALHHTISTAAALANWHAAIAGQHTAMRPGIDPAEHGITKESGAAC